MLNVPIGRRRRARNLPCSMPARAPQCNCTGRAVWLLDTGSARDYGHFLRDYLHSQGIDRLDGLVLSHGDSLHIGGANAVLDEFRPRRVIDNGAQDRSSVHRALVVRLAERKISEEGLGFAVGREVTARILYPDPRLQRKGGR